MHVNDTPMCFGSCTNSHTSNSKSKSTDHASHRSCRDMGNLGNNNTTPGKDGGGCGCDFHDLGRAPALCAESFGVMLSRHLFACWGEQRGMRMCTFTLLCRMPCGLGDWRKCAQVWCFGLHSEREWCHFQCWGVESKYRISTGICVWG